MISVCSETGERRPSCRLVSKSWEMSAKWVRRGMEMGVASKVVCC